MLLITKVAIEVVYAIPDQQNSVRNTWEPQVRSTWRCLRSSSRYRDGSAIVPGIHKWSGLCWWWLQGISHYQLHQKCVRAMCMTSGGTDLCQELWLQCICQDGNTFAIFSSPVWGPPQITTTRDIEQIQRRAARIAYNCYQDNSAGCVTNLLRDRRSPLLCNSWLVQWQSADGGSCSTLQGIASIVFAGGIPIEDCLGNDHLTWKGGDADSLEDFKVRLNSILWLSSQHR
jgi:hypothetical protein